MVNIAIDDRFGQRLHEALLLVQRRNRKARLAFTSPLSTVDAIALSIISSIDNLTPSNLSDCLRLPPSRISRLLATLVERELISTVQHHQDLRSKVLLFTALGRRTSREVDLINLRVMKLLSAGLSTTEQTDIVQILTALADGICSFTFPERTILAALKRLTAGLGMLGDNYAGTEIPLARFQILFDLWRNGGRCSFRDLSDNFPLSSSSLSRECSALASLGLVSKHSHSTDRRGVIMEITEDGNKFFLRHHAEIGDRFKRAVRTLSSEQIERGLRALTKASLQSREDLPSDTLLECLTCDSESSLQQARGFFVEQLVRASAHHALESELLPNHHRIFVVSAQQEIMLLVELVPTNSSATVLKRVICANSLNGSLLRRALKQIPLLREVDKSSLFSAQLIPSELQEDILREIRLL